jgi:hypothetical protein
LKQQFDFTASTCIGCPCVPNIVPVDVLTLGTGIGAGAGLGGVGFS